MFTERIVEALKHSKQGAENNQTLEATMAKIQGQKRLSSKEFLSAYDAIWSEGPKTLYQNPNAWRTYREVV